MKFKRIQINSFQNSLSSFHDGDKNKCDENNGNIMNPYINDNHNQYLSKFSNCSIEAYNILREVSPEAQCLINESNEDMIINTVNQIWNADEMCANQKEDSIYCKVQ